MTLRTAILAAGLSAAAILSSSISAGANGCNGVVNQLVWGCAAWDNNNGPQFPNYKGPAAAPRVAAPVPAPSLAPRQAPLVAAGGGNLVAAGGGNRQAGH